MSNFGTTYRAVKSSNVYDVHTPLCLKFELTLKKMLGRFLILMSIRADSIMHVRDVNWDWGKSIR